MSISPRVGQRPGLANLLTLAILPWPVVALSLYVFHRYELAFVGYHLTCFLGYWLYGTGRLSLRRHLLQPYTLGGLLLCLPALAVVHPFVDSGMVRHVMAGFGVQPSHLPFIALYFLTVQPLAEEAFWRGTLLEGLTHHLGDRNGALLSSFLFGAWHALVVWPLMPALWWLAVLAVCLFGYAMVVVYRRNGGELWPCILVHALGGDLPLLLVLFLAFAGH